jgi:hypothetical protein
MSAPPLSELPAVQKAAGIELVETTISVALGILAALVLAAAAVMARRDRRRPPPAAGVKPPEPAPKVYA